MEFFAKENMYKLKAKYGQYNKLKSQFYFYITRVWNANGKRIKQCI